MKPEDKQTIIEAISAMLDDGDGLVMTMMQVIHGCDSIEDHIRSSDGWMVDVEDHEVCEELGAWLAARRQREAQMREGVTSAARCVALIIGAKLDPDGLKMQGDGGVVIFRDVDADGGQVNPGLSVRKRGDMWHVTLGAGDPHKADSPAEAAVAAATAWVATYRGKQVSTPVTTSTALDATESELREALALVASHMTELGRVRVEQPERIEDQRLYAVVDANGVGAPVVIEPRGSWWGCSIGPGSPIVYEGSTPKDAARLAAMVWIRDVRRAPEQTTDAVDAAEALRCAAVMLDAELDDVEWNSGTWYAALHLGAETRAARIGRYGGKWRAYVGAYAASGETAYEAAMMVAMEYRDTLP